MVKELKLCIVCTKRREHECSHIDCPNRKPWGAGPFQPTGTIQPKRESDYAFTPSRNDGHD